MKTKFYLTAAAVLYATVIGSAYAENDASSIEDAKIGMAQAVTTAEQHVGGKAVHAEYEHHKDQSTFDVEVVKDKKIMKVKVDPTSGKVISSVEDKDDEHKKHDKHHKADKSDKVD
jgi:uncharacterized membrane protein YkoI